MSLHCEFISVHNWWKANGNKIEFIFFFWPARAGCRAYSTFSTLFSDVSAYVQAEESVAEERSEGHFQRAICSSWILQFPWRITLVRSEQLPFEASPHKTRGRRGPGDLQASRGRQRGIPFGRYFRLAALNLCPRIEKLKDSADGSPKNFFSSNRRDSIVPWAWIKKIRRNGFQKLMTLLLLFKNHYCYY